MVQIKPKNSETRVIKSDKTAHLNSLPGARLPSTIAPEYAGISQENSGLVDEPAALVKDLAHTLLTLLVL